VAVLARIYQVVAVYRGRWNG